MDKRLLDILCCPATHAPLRALSAPELEAVNRAIAGGQLRDQGLGIEVQVTPLIQFGNQCSDQKRIPFRGARGV